MLRRFPGDLRTRWSDLCDFDAADNAPPGTTWCLFLSGTGIECGQTTCHRLLYCFHDGLVDAELSPWPRRLTLVLHSSNPHRRSLSVRGRPPPPLALLGP